MSAEHVGDADQPIPEARLRSLCAAEVRRIGTEELAQRLGTSTRSIEELLNGENPKPELVEALNFYDFGDFPDLRGLLRGYFYESYYYQSSPELWQPVVDRFVRAESPGRVRGAGEDISRLLDQIQDDAELRRELDDMGCYFAFDLIELTQREWLAAVRDRIHDRLLRLNHVG